jgi:hypothetical protein
MYSASMLDKYLDFTPESETRSCKKGTGSTDISIELNLDRKRIAGGVHKDNGWESSPHSL